jgi:hypothetical protein
LAIKYDHTLEKVQKIAQLIFVWVIPIIGAGFVLHLVFDHSPDVIPRSWIPWPFKGLIYGPKPKPNKNRDETEIDYYAGRSRHGGHDSSGGDSGGGD